MKMTTIFKINDLYDNHVILCPQINFKNGRWETFVTNILIHACGRFAIYKDQAQFD